MPSKTSLIRRVAWGSALSASGAALLSALVTVTFAAYLVQRAEDRRLREAAVTLATELDTDAQTKTVESIVRDEAEELNHTGMLFAVIDEAARVVAGDRRLGLPGADDCATVYGDTLRACRARSALGVTAVVASTHTTPLPMLATAALLAVMIAAALAWMASRPVSRYAVAPLLRLRSRIAALDIDELSQADLGRTENVLEVDALRETVGHLILRVERALDQAQRFAANAAHELRTPLTSVRAELDLLDERLTEESVRCDVRRAQQKLAELSVLVERLLILAVPTDVATTAKELVSIRDLLEDAVAGLPTEDAQRVRTPEDDALVRGDAVLLSTMITNALSNALKFGQHVNAGLRVLDESVVVLIEDDGPGVQAEERERTFEPFFRSSDAVRLRVPGHGLGLALIRHIARTHGGDASFAAESSRGARLEIQLPLYRGETQK